MPNMSQTKMNRIAKKGSSLKTIIDYQNWLITLEVKKSIEAIISRWSIIFSSYAIKISRIVYKLVIPRYHP